MSEFAFELMDTESQKANIKVIGVGGSGGNAVSHMVNHGIQGEDFLCANTDAQDLSKSNVETKIQIGIETTKGLGAGMDPNVGRSSAEESRKDIENAIDGADMLFITAGFGGGTGTGASPVIAKIAKDMNILTVAVVTRPFYFEGALRSEYAENGIEELEKNVDSLIIVPNDKLQELGKTISMINAFEAADDILLNSVQGIVELITVPGKINLDFADVRAVMLNKGRGIMGSAIAIGPDRAKKAIEEAINSPLLEDTNLEGAEGILLNVTFGNDLAISEFNEIGNIVRSYASDEAKVIVGTSVDESMSDSIRVTIVATGLGERPENQKTNFRNYDNPITQRKPLVETQDLFKDQEVNPIHDKDSILFNVPEYLKRKDD